MNKKRNIIILICVILVIILVLWITGVIPKKIAQITATNYLKNNFPKINLEFEDIEWSSSFGGYVISFKDENDDIHGFIMNNKYFPISLGQGMFGFREMYREKYENEEISINVINYISEVKQENLLSNADELKKVLDSYDYKGEICEGIANYTLECSDGTQYDILVDCCGIVKDGKEATISDEEMKQIEDFIKDNSNINHNVTIEVLEDTITNESVEILITDKNEDSYGWGAAFRVQEKINGKWKDLDFIVDDVAWIEIAYNLNENNQLKQKLNVENYYGILNKGIYRIVKTIYNNEYIDIYSNEFEIK